MTYAAKELTRSTWADFERLFSPGRGWSFCACMLYQRGCHLDAKKFSDRASSLVQNQAEKRSLVDAGRAHGILVYNDREPIGWCQFGPAEELPLPGAIRLDRRMPSLGAGVRWRITCFVTTFRWRRRGVATTALRSTLKAIRKARRRAGRGVPDADAAQSKLGSCGHRVAVRDARGSGPLAGPARST